MKGENTKLHKVFSCFLIVSMEPKMIVETIDHFFEKKKWMM